MKKTGDNGFLIIVRQASIQFPAIPATHGTVFELVDNRVFVC